MNWPGQHVLRCRDNGRGIATDRTFRAFLIVALVLLSGCKTENKTTGLAGPVIEFSRVPRAAAGNANKLTAIAGRVHGAEPGQAIVLYANSGDRWWVQPFTDQPFTSIKPDSTWRNLTHPGTEYAALLVDPTFHPSTTADILPTQGVYATAIIQGELPFWRKRWFPLACLLAGMLVAIGLYRLRLYQLTRRMNLHFEERLRERTRVAQELHDTLLQGVISASMQLHVIVDQLPAGSPAQPALARILQLMGEVIEEGRNTLRGIRSPSEGSDQVEQGFLRMRRELGMDEKINFRVVVEGSPRPLQSQVRNEIYSIGREAMVNAFRHSGANNLEVELEYAANKMTVLVRDNGCGIDPHLLRAGRDEHWGLSGMRDRASRIGASLRVLSAVSAGTEIELCIPGRIAFVPQTLDTRKVWFSKLYSRKMKAAKSVAENGRHS
ncbi:MAG: sensor histidine kinase [Candidatus Acidiferrum sp.]|jgi:signal transduction histidine kinase